MAAKPIIFFILATLSLLLAIALLGASIWGPGKVHRLIESGINKTIIVDSVNASSYASWADSRESDDPPVHMSFYLFNVTNPDDILQGAKPIVEEVGPYSYVEEKVKFNITFLENGTQVKYWQWEFFTFDANKSKPGLDPDTDVLTIVSLPFQAVWAGLAIVGDDRANYFQQMIAYTNSTPFVTNTATKLIFGYPDPLLAAAATLNSATPLTLPLQANQTSETDGETNTTFSIQYTGKGNLQLIHNFIAYNGVSNLTFWGSDDANIVRGSDGYNFGPDVNKSQPVEVFVSNILRKGFASYNSTTDLFGIELYGFTLNSTQMQNVSQNPANEEYYAYGFPSGQLNLTAASQGVPIFISKPHWLDGDPIYLESVDGVTPAVVDKHDTVLWVEPTTGITMSSYKRLQINVKFEPITPFTNISEVYFPVLWIEEGGELTQKQADEFRSKVYTAQNVRKYGPIAGFIVAGVLALVSIVFVILAVRSGDTEERRPLLRDDA